MQATDGKNHDKGDKFGAYQSFEQGRDADVSCACHWTVDVAASSGMASSIADLYSVSPCGVFVPPDSPVSTPEDLAGVPISVGYQSGSHYATIQALEQYLPPDKINLSFADGMLFKRMELLLDGKVPAASLFSGPYYFAEQLGFRKIIDTTFMIATMITGDPDPEDLRKYFRALQPAQRDIDLRPERYTHYYKKEFPVRFHEQMDTRRWGPGERIVFEPYTRDCSRSPMDRRPRHFPRRTTWAAARLRAVDPDAGPASWRERSQTSAGTSPARRPGRVRGARTLPAAGRRWRSRKPSTAALRARWC